MEDRTARIPVTLLTGFLGAGKTTLLNHLIRDPEAGRVAVIINEFGDVGLDHDLIEEATDETILMPSGCICCTIRSDLLKTLGKLLSRRNEGKLSFDRIIIETTGIADPGPVMHSLVVDQFVGPHFRMDGVVTVADAATGPRILQEQHEAANQVAMADLIVISKTDLVTPNDLARFEAQLRELNGAARHIRADHGKIPIGAVFGLSALRADVTPHDVSNWLGQAIPPPDPLAGLSGLQPNEKPALPFSFGETQGGHNISSAAIEVAEPIHASVFDHWLDTLITLKGPQILRVKGIVHIQDVAFPFVFHGVQHIFDVPVPLETWAGHDTVSRVVVIARDMSKAELEASLNTLLMAPRLEEPETEGMMVQTAQMPF